MKTIAVLVINYNQRHYLKNCFESLKKQTSKIDAIYYVDNASTDDSLEFVKKNYPKVKTLKNTKNEGFARAVNKGMKQVFKDGYQFCILLNPDVALAPKAVGALLDTFNEKKKNAKVGLIQPVLLLQKQKDTINGIGNAIHYLGFGYCRDYLRKYRPLKQDRSIVFASGAVMLVPRVFFSDIGYLDDSFFLYCDDQDYSWRGSIAGYEHFLSSKAMSYHDYSFSRYESKMYHFEKNRWTMLLKNYSGKTLVLLSPALFTLEVAMLFYSLFHGFFTYKLKAYWYTISHVSDIRKKRKQIQKTRTDTDKEIFSRFDATFDFFLMRKMKGISLLNGLSSFYFKLILSLL